MRWLTAITQAVRGVFRTAEETTNDWSTVDPSALWGAGGKTRAGIRVSSEDSAMTCATAYACTRAIAENVGSLPGIVYRTTGTDEREKDKGSRAWRLLHDRPNPDMDAMTFYEMGTARCCNRGNFFAQIVPNGRGEPAELWPIHNSRVVPWRTSDGELEYHVYVNQRDRSNPRGFGYYNVRSNEMFNLVGFNSKDGILAPGVIKHGAEELGLDIASQAYGSSWFGNGARPSGLVSHPSFIKDEERRREFRKDINSLHQGVENWNKVGILWEGSTWQQMEVAPEQAQFLGTRVWQAKVLCRLWNVPPAIVQIYDEFKFSSVEAMIRCFVMLTIRPWAVRWERAIRRQLLISEDVYLQEQKVFGEADTFEFAIAALLRGDPKLQAEADNVYLSMGVYNPDEVRRRENLNPIAGGYGQTHLAPANFTTLRALATGTATTTSKRPPGKETKAGRPFARYAQRVVDDAYSRMLTCEAREAQRTALASPSTWMTWLDKHYAAWTPKLAESLVVGIEGYALACRKSIDARAVATRVAVLHCEESKRQLIEAADGNPDGFVGRVTKATLAWASRRVNLKAEVLHAQRVAD